ncbi:hypothetical protein ACS0TY_004109 [Phlomoides rotata]
MSLSPLRSRTLYHGRSLSFPSASNSVVSQFDDNLSRLTSSEAACSSLSSMNSRVNGLTNLYNSIDDLLLQPHNQQIVSEPILDDYIRLLDSCSGVKDLVSLTKQNLRELLSSLRRKDVNGINCYLISRRKSKKMIQSYLKNLRSCTSNVVEKETSLESMLKGAESAALSVLESLVSYTRGQAKKSGWSKLIHSKKPSHALLNEFDKVDSFLQLNQENEELLNHLKEMDSTILVLEQELEFLFRQLIKTRVSLLNILNH